MLGRTIVHISVLKRCLVYTCTFTRMLNDLSVNMCIFVSFYDFPEEETIMYLTRTTVVIEICQKGTLLKLIKGI